jgi:hypothetical protein
MGCNEADAVRSARPKGKKCREKKRDLKKTIPLDTLKKHDNMPISRLLNISIGSFYE